MILKIHSKAPNFKLPNQDNKLIELHTIEANIIIFFYPKDNTPGCTLEAIGFSKFKTKFNKLGCQIFGISKDSVKKHQNFISKQNLTIDLLSDQDQKVCENYGVWVEKSMYGKTYMGTLRSTFAIASDGKLEWVGYGVKTKGHVDSLIDALKVE